MIRADIVRIELSGAMRTHAAMSVTAPTLVRARAQHRAAGKIGTDNHDIRLPPHRRFPRWKVASDCVIFFAPAHRETKRGKMKSDFSNTYIKRLDLNLLWVFYALLKHHKVTAAAEYLSMTQSAVSQALARLRSTCDDPLFVRTGHGLRPTERALALEPHVTQIIEMATRTFLSAPGLESTIASELRIGMPDNVSKALTSFVGFLRHEAPGLRLNVRHIWGRKGLEALIEGEIDLALFHIANAPSEIERRILYHESFALVARRGHPLAESFDLTGYCEAEHVVVSFAGDGRGLVDARPEQLGRTRRVVSTLPLFRATLHAVACSDMIALVNRSLALAEAERLGLVVMAPPRELELAPYPVHVAWHRRQARNALCRWTADQIIKHMPEGFADG